MRISSSSKNGQPEYIEDDHTESKDQDARFLNPKDDPEFQELIEHFQHADFSACKDLLTKLEQRYPDNGVLLGFKDDLQMKLSLKNMEVLDKKDEKRKIRKVSFRLLTFAIICAVVILLVFFVSYYFLNIESVSNQRAQETAQLSSLYEQVQQLLIIGKPQEAAEIIENILEINPEFDKLPELTTQTYDLMQLETKYKAALGLISENSNADALAMMKEIEAVRPGIWDVSQQITSLEDKIQIEKYLAAGDAAYKVEMWDLVISSYENALALDTTLNDPVMKEQLFGAYLNKILNMLQNDSVSIQDIQDADKYYRNAVTLIPMHSDFDTEREELQEVSSYLLGLKYTQVAKENIEDKNQTSALLADSVSYLVKATNLNPNNKTLRIELENAKLYESAFNNFNDKKWEFAIENLTKLLEADKNYANGNASVLLYEAYFALGKKYYTAGFYEDARTKLEQAEFLAWEDEDNLLKLFQVQVLLGDSIAKTGDYVTAISYYKYALDAIQVIPRLANLPTLLKNYTDANNWIVYGNTEMSVITFQDLLAEIGVIYSISEAEIKNGSCLAFFADSNLSTIDAILEANHLPQDMVLTFGRILEVPSINK